MKWLFVFLFKIWCCLIDMSIGCNVVFDDFSEFKVINDGVIIVCVIDFFNLIENVGVVFIREVMYI